jgi:hypothetical protein
MKRNLMEELKEGIDALAESRKVPQSAYILPDEKTAYIAVWLTPSNLVIRLLQTKDQLDIKLDKKILPHLVDALIDLQNQK